MGTRHDELRQDLDLDQLEGVPTDRSDTIIYTEPERLSAEVVLLKGIRLKFVSLTSSRSPAGVALAIMMLAFAATVPTAVIGMILHLAGVPGWLTATGTLATFAGVTTTGIGPIHHSARQHNASTEQPPPQPPPRQPGQPQKAKSARRSRHRRK